MEVEGKAKGTFFSASPGGKRERKKGGGDVFGKAKEWDSKLDDDEEDLRNKRQRTKGLSKESLEFLSSLPGFIPDAM